MLTLDEAISREEALAYSFGERYKRLGEPVGDLMKLEQEHRQMAEWLRELKMYKDLEAQGYAMYNVSEVMHNDDRRSNKAL